jgi:hypothetical protein
MAERADSSRLRVLGIVALNALSDAPDRPQDAVDLRALMRALPACAARD